MSSDEVEPMQISYPEEPAMPKLQGNTDAYGIEQINHSQLCDLAYHIGKARSEDLRKSALDLSRQRNVDELRGYDSGDSTGEGVDLVMAFLKGVAYTNPHSLASAPYRLNKTVESILNLTAINLTLPTHLRESLVLYSMTGSKLALQLLGKGGAHASYASVKAWLRQLGVDTLDVPDGDLVITFDNNQVLERRWKVKLKNEVRCNIVTVVASFKMSDLSLQNNKSFKVDTTRINQKNIESLKFIDQQEDVKNTHYSHLYSYIQKQIDIVKSEQVVNEGHGFTDLIDRNVAEKQHAAHFKTCYNCDFRDIPKSKHACPMCKVKVTKAMFAAMNLDEVGNAKAEETRPFSNPREYKVTVKKGDDTLPVSVTCEQQDTFEPSVPPEYHEVMLDVPEPQIPTINVLEPIYVNPCSYESVAIVLRNIGRKCGITRHGGKRAWVAVACDGLPYTLCNRLLKSSFLCLTCSANLNGADECVQHENEFHEQSENVQIVKEFDWVVLVPGSGHIEINMVRGIIELGWDIFWKELAMTMNFRSETALRYAKAASDHHKAWTLCRISREALTKELIVPFVRAQLVEEDPDLSSAAFFKFIMKAVDPNYTFMCDFTFELLDAIFMYRAGIRGSIKTFIRAGRAKFAKLWSGRNHPLYRELEAADSILLENAPKELQDLLLQAASVNLTGQPFTGEGVDFRLEEINQKIQFWLPNIPSAHDWKLACSNFDKLSELRALSWESLGTTDPKVQLNKKEQSIVDEESAFRTKLRSKNYLVQPGTRRAHVSLSGEVLDADLVNFCMSSRIRRAEYVESYIAYAHDAGLHKCHSPAHRIIPVFVNSAERKRYTAVENLNVSEIKTMIQSNI